jgi:hypothetical protein
VQASTASLDQGLAAAPGAFARQTRLPRDARVATAYGTENLRPASVVNRVTETSRSSLS